MSSTANDEPPRHARLTPREREVVSLVAAGHTNKQIAATLGIAQRTVETHRENITRKLGTTSLAALVRYALRHGLTND